MSCLAWQKPKRFADDEQRADLAGEGVSFIPKAIDDPDFLASGVVYGGNDDCWWAVVDPRVHPLYVWKKAGTYGSSAQTLNAAIVTNGPMMGKRLGTRKVTRGSVPWTFAKWTIVGIIAGWTIAGHGWPTIAGLLAGIGGAAMGVAYSWTRIFMNWSPCGTVYSRDADIDDRRNFDDEGKTHAWMGRFARDFASYQIGPGDLPRGVREGVGGLIMLVRDFIPAYQKLGDAAFKDFANLSLNTGVVAWGLVPLNKGDKGGGVIVVVGSQKALDCEAMAARLCSIGIRDAVAMDTRACSMMGTARRFMIGPPPPHRQAMQLYGLYCR